jgi:ornithine carbamoyltransferase
MSYRQNNNDEIKRVTGIATMNDLDKATITAILKLAIQIKRNPQHYTHALYQKTLMMMFQKPSLRTRVSFETGYDLKLFTNY